MSKKRDVARELLEQQAKYKKQNKILLVFLLILFVPPLLLFPAFPKNLWQYEIYRYITERMFIIIGTKGPLPFFTILSSIYVTIVMLILSVYLCFLFIKNVGIKKQFQEVIYSKFFQAEFEASKKHPWLEKPFIKKTIVSGMFFFCLIMGMIHFLMDNISFQDGSRRGALIQLGYNYRIGVLFWESTFSVFTIFPFFYFGFLFIYLYNYFFRGLGTGKIIIPQKNRLKEIKREHAKVTKPLC